MTKKFVVIRVTRIIPAWIAGIELQRFKKQTRNENVNLQNLFTFWLSDKLSIWNRQNYQNWRCEIKVFRMLQLALCKLKALHWNIDIWNLYKSMNSENLVQTITFKKKKVEVSWAYWLQIRQMTYLEYFCNNQAKRTKRKSEKWEKSDEILNCRNYMTD